MNNIGHDNQSPFNNFGYSQFFAKFIPPELWEAEKKSIKKLSLAGAVSILLFIAASNVFTIAVQIITSMINTVTGGSEERFLALYDSAVFLYLFQSLYTIIAVGLPFFVVGAAIYKKQLINMLPMGKPLNAKYLPLIVLGGFGVCLAGNIITSYFDILFESITGLGLEMPETPSTPNSAGGVFLSFLSTAIVPALIEEFALRGVIMQPLRRYGDWFAIIASSLIFGLMHCNLLQIPFAFIAGIAIGYAVIVTESIWTGIIIHFFNNGFAVAVSTIADFYGTDSEIFAASNIIFYGLIIAGLICAFIYVKFLQKKPLKQSSIVNRGGKIMGFAPYPSAQISNGTLFKTYILTIPMIIAFIVVSIETVAALLLF